MPAVGVPTVPVDFQYKPQYIPGLPAVDWSKLEDKKPREPWTVKHAAETGFLATTGFLGGWYIGTHFVILLFPALISAKEILKGRPFSLRARRQGPELAVASCLLAGIPALFSVLIKRIDGSPLHPVDKATCGVGTVVLAAIVLGKLAAYKNR
jgi:hypothetical protein